MKQSEASQRQILAAAAAEFSQHGIAGARVDRIAQRSAMSKPMIYTYFGSKDKLFDAVFKARVIDNNQRVPFTADDLPGYATRLYDDYVDDPALIRLIMWKRLERSSDGYLYPTLEDVDAQHIRAIADRQKTSDVRDDIDADDVWALLISSATTWAQGSITIVALTSDPVEHHSRRRKALYHYVAAALAPRRKSPAIPGGE